MQDDEVRQPAPNQPCLLSKLTTAPFLFAITPLPKDSAAQLLQKIEQYLPIADVERVREAYRFSDEIHLGQKRDSGEPYITHPIAVAEICAEWRLDAQAIMAAFLHDVLEDSNTPKPYLVERFGTIVADLVDGLSKIERLNFSSRAQFQAENFRKMLLAMDKDLRVILIKLADRLHNMRTISLKKSVESRRRVAHETLEIYAPIAHRLGLNTVYQELQLLAFESLFPRRFKALQQAVVSSRGLRQQIVGETDNMVRKRLSEQHITYALQGREKNLWSIYQKMAKRRSGFNQVLDVYGFRLLVNDISTCYQCIGFIHGLFKPIPGRFKDYIAIPKVNGYQSLHTTVIGPHGTPLEFQIRTHDMHQVAERGIAAHWLYKDPENGLREAQKRTHKWLKSLLDIQHQNGDSQEFIEHIKVDLYPDEVYVFTPKSTIFSLPRGSTAVDFAYQIHSEIGQHCVSAKINGLPSPIKAELRNGDVVEIITNTNNNPSVSWLGFVRTGKARSEIRHYIRTQKHQEAITMGRRLLLRALTAHGLNLQVLEDHGWDKLLLQQHSQKTSDALFASIGLGERLPVVVARLLADQIQHHRSQGLSEEGASETPLNDAHSHGLATEPEHVREELTATPEQNALVLLNGREGHVHYADCCHPLPGDSIVTIPQGDQGLMVHRASCKQLRRKRRQRWLDVAFAPDVTGFFKTKLSVSADNTQTMLAQIAANIGESAANIAHISMSNDEGAISWLHFVLQVRDRDHLKRITRNLRHVRDVHDIK